MVDIHNIQKCGNMEIMENILNDKKYKKLFKQNNEEKEFVKIIKKSIEIK